MDVKQLLLIFDFFEKAQNIILIGLIAIIVVVCIVIMAKFKGSRKILMYIFAGIIVVGGVFHGAQLIKKLTAESYINGSINIENVYNLENYNYKTNAIVFTENEGVYVCTATHLPVIDYNGQENKYTIVINDYYLPTETTTGSAVAVMYIDFYGIENNIECSVELKIRVNFYVDKTELILNTNTQTEANYITKYVTENGFKIQVIKEAK